MNRALPYLYPAVLLLVFSLLYFTMLDQPVIIDYDEGVYAEVSRAMYLAQEPIIPHLNGEEFFEKPPMLYWAQMLGYKTFGVNALGARFFNGLAALLTLLIFYFGSAGPVGRKTAFQATLLLGSSVIFVYLSRVAMTDMLLTLFLVSSLVFSWHGVERYLEKSEGAPLFWLGCLAAGLAMLSKGAIGLLFPAVTACLYLLSIGRPTILFSKKWFFPGTAFLLLSGFSWYLLLGIFHPDGFDFMKELFLNHHVGRFSAAMEGHSGPLFYYLIILFVGFMPWFGYLLRALFILPLRTKGDPSLRYLRLFWIFSVIVLVFFSLAATKLPNYILPALPGFSLLVAHLFHLEETAAQQSRSDSLSWRVAGWLGGFPVALLGLACLALPFVFPYLAELIGEDAYKVPALFEPVSLGVTPYLAGVLFILSAILIFRTRHTHPSRRFEFLLLSSLVNGCTIFFLIIPLYDRLLDAPLARLAREAASHTSAEGRLVMYEIDDRPSVNFVSGLQTVDHDRRKWSDLPLLFDQDGIEVGLTTAFHFERLQNLGLAPVEISRDTGFVLFRLPPEPSPDTSE